MAIVRVRNLTALPIVLNDADGDSVQLPAHADSKVDERFINFQRPNPAQVRVLPVVGESPVLVSHPDQDAETE